MRPEFPLYPCEDSYDLLNPVILYPLVSNQPVLQGASYLLGQQLLTLSPTSDWLSRQDCVASCSWDALRTTTGKKVQQVTTQKNVKNGNLQGWLKSVIRQTDGIT